MSIQDNYLKTSDGFFARLQPSLDAVEEVTVTTAGNTADANSQGGAQIKFVTRSGTNSWTGSVYEYYRNDKFNSNTWFNNRDLPPDPETGKAPKAQLRRHTPGFRIGGPIKQNKAFFFVNYEQARQPSNLTQNRIVLTQAAMSGKFAYTAGGVTRQVDLLALAASIGQAIDTRPDRREGDVGYQFGDENTGFADGPVESGGSAVHVPGADIEPESLVPQGGYHLNINGACCTGSNALYNVDSFTGATATYQAREASTRIIDDTVTWIKGSHSIAFGTSFTQGDLWIDNRQLVPTINFGLVTGDPAIGLFNPTNFPNASTTDINNARGLYSMLVGKVLSVVGDARLTPAGDKFVYLGTGRAQARLREFDFFAADSWRATPNLTINYGLRYALQFPFYPMNAAYTTATLDSLWGVS